MKKPGKAYSMPKAKLRQPKQKMLPNKKRISAMSKRLKVNPYSKKN